MSEIKQIAIVGAGRVAHQLAPALQSRGVEIVGVYGRNSQQADRLAHKLHTSVLPKLDGRIKADLILLTVSDDAIAAVAQRLHPATKALVAHTSGAVNIDAIPGSLRKAVFYPLQSFSIDKQVVWENVPFCIEADDDSDLNALGALADLLSSKVYILSSEQRKNLHLAAVFANNFANLMYEFSEELLHTAGIDRTILHPLILETANKVLMQTAAQSQTGPASRGDLETIKAHQYLLPTESIYRKVYDILTDEILRRNHGSKL